MNINAEQLAAATHHLNQMVSSLRADLSDGAGLSPDEFAAMVATLKQYVEPEWIDALMWVVAVATARLAGWPQ